MELNRKNLVAKWIIAYEIVAFAFVIALIWVDELFDIPYLILGAEPTPINWRESLFESAFILVLGFFIISFSYRLIERMKHLEGILPVCASCKKIRDDKNNWHQIEVFIRERSDADFSHGICPDCAEKLYPELKKLKKG